MKINIAPETQIIVVTGPESSGKTTLVQTLSKKYGLPVVKEYARIYLTEKGPRYDLSDIQTIAEEQIKNESFAHQNHALIICDTDLVTLQIWTSEKYDIYLDRTDTRLAKKHYLLCYPDIPWEPDPLRENPNDRLRLLSRYEKYLDDLNAAYTVLKERDRRDLVLAF